ncbi:hypothetical protein BDV26DRAFT_276995 [Aspergillus bertholletiae]|uniref:N-acetyltransferase domain-containing protein n=1 Tax=Aspergillus bertholletiae TaxID=1226010 RepID=A0A5N7BPH0_9EURO|nr:hypothetical protein BDV26DRAFT_276995 [Aspergillus bertholletiae]
MVPGLSVPLEIKYANASDLSALVSIEIRAFPSSNYMRSTYKGCDLLAAHTFKTVSSLEYFTRSKCHMLAGIDSETGGIIAYSRWTIPAMYRFERAVDTSLSNNAQAQMQNMWAYAPRIGIGSAFLKWGIVKADTSNARIYLEATMEGVPVYLKHGWKIVEEIQLDYTERGGEGSQKFALMIRDPQGTGL